MKSPKFQFEFKDEDWRFPSFCIVWIDWISQQILRIYLSRIRPYSQKIIYSPRIFLWVCKSKKFIEVWKYLFQGSKQRYPTQFLDLWIFSGFSLTISPLWNSISSWVLGVSVCMSPWSDYNICRSTWSTSHPKWSSGAFAIRDAISLSDNNSVKSVWPRILWIIQNIWRIGRSCHNEKCSKLDLLPPRNFIKFLSIPSYFN
jgi:hypothetical protein